MVDAVPRTPVNAQLRYSGPARFAIAKITSLEPFNPGQNARFGLAVAQGSELFGEWLAAILRLVAEQLEHANSVTYMLQVGKSIVGQIF